MSAPFSVRRRGTVLVVTGELDAATAPLLTTWLTEQPAPRVVDLSEITFADSAGLVCLWRLRTRLDARLTHPSDRVARIAGFDDLFDDGTDDRARAAC